MTLEQTIQATLAAHYRVMNVVGDFSSYRCACGAEPWLNSHLASELSKAVEGQREYTQDDMDEGRTEAHAAGYKLAESTRCEREAAAVASLIVALRRIQDMIPNTKMTDDVHAVIRLALAAESERLRGEAK
jgi:hypothetical protein